MCKKRVINNINANNNNIYTSDLQDKMYNNDNIYEIFYILLSVKFFNVFDIINFCKLCKLSKIKIRKLSFFNF